ncbi:hypothetical protein FNL39_1201 [Nocardia caishijiensis]|uniref:MarR family transcriptional regulator n=1 Tax=Nocardia caishijiensis TaxID=184756 RepID=A0ABQ6YE55_9NOCA|nr:hypothetical protein FNL39_1201 [Nocardia caishijiensis]
MTHVRTVYLQARARFTRLLFDDAGMSTAEYSVVKQ